MAKKADREIGRHLEVGDIMDEYEWEKESEEIERELAEVEEELRRRRRERNGGGEPVKKSD